MFVISPIAASVSSNEALGLQARDRGRSDDYAGVGDNPSLNRLLVFLKFPILPPASASVRQRSGAGFPYNFRMSGPSWEIMLLTS
jgi:hypothetical protein